MAEVWILDDDRSIRFVLAEALRDSGLSVRDFDNARAALSVLSQATPDVVISDVRMPGMDGIKFLDAIKQSAPNVPIIIMSAYTDMPTTASAFRAGAFDFLSKPFDLDHAIDLVRRALGAKLAEHAIEPVSKISSERHNKLELIGDTASMRELFRVIGRVAPTELSVLLVGETGTGKELVARALHQHSHRNLAPFIALNTAAIPAELLEAELFGHEAGAFTGANKRGIGRFEQAMGGTLFLDEIGDMPLALQTRLLRVLAAGEFYRVGGRELIRSDVRIIAATHQNLERKVQFGEFRADLLHRLDVVRIQLPSLRERRDDIERLAQQFLRDAQSDLRAEIKQFEPAAMRVLRAYDWPGNVRELENLCRRLAVMASGRVIRLEDIPHAIKASLQPTIRLTSNQIRDHNQDVIQPDLVQPDLEWQGPLRSWAERMLASDDPDIFTKAQHQFEQIMLQAALDKTGGNRQLAAKRLGLGRNTITRKLGSSRSKP